jgi:hypothetical protein
LARQTSANGRAATLSEKEEIRDLFVPNFFSGCKRCDDGASLRHEKERVRRPPQRALLLRPRAFHFARRARGVGAG